MNIISRDFLSSLTPSFLSNMGGKSGSTWTLPFFGSFRVGREAKDEALLAKRDIGVLTPTVETVEKPSLSEVEKVKANLKKTKAALALALLFGVNNKNPKVRAQSLVKVLLLKAQIKKLEEELMFAEALEGFEDEPLVTERSETPVVPVNINFTELLQKAEEAAKEAKELPETPEVLDESLDELPMMDFGFGIDVSTTAEEDGELSAILETAQDWVTEYGTSIFGAVRTWAWENRTGIAEIADIAQTAAKVGLYLAILNAHKNEDHTRVEQLMLQLNAIGVSSTASVAITAARQNVPVLHKYAPNSEDGTRGNLSKGVGTAVGIIGSVVTGDLPSAVVATGLAVANSRDQENVVMAIVGTTQGSITTGQKLANGDITGVQALKEVAITTAEYTAIGIGADVLTSPKGIKARLQEWIQWLIFQPYTNMKNAESKKMKALHFVDLTARVFVATTVCLVVLTVLTKALAPWLVIAKASLCAANTIVPPIYATSTKACTLAASLFI
ncbi:MAG: hypothetical protein K940chlam8_00192 [Chlamydiae bacterium]|nr:hypothetical protein [Chlamydiota bacterium]